jgi:choline dehydrogenase-like flavoprotein
LIRGYQVGGKSLTWGRACQRWSPLNLRAGTLWLWPSLAYQLRNGSALVQPRERFIGVCGHKDGIEAMPDGEFLPPFEFNCVESHLQQKIKAHYRNRHLVQGRWAQLTQLTALHLAQGRGRCLARNLCMRGCPYGGYFSSVSSTLPWANKTGNLTIRPHSVVHSIIYDEKRGTAAGVRVIDAQTFRQTDFFAKVVFVNASALNSNLILLNSKSNRFRTALGMTAAYWESM